MLKSTLVALGMLALAAAAGAGEVKMQGVQQQVQVASKDGKVRVTVTLENGNAKPVYVPKAVFEDDELFGRVFDIRDASGKEIDYIGPMVKRGPYTRADYLAVKPGDKHSNTIDITRSYAFKPGTHSYTLAYPGSYVPDLAKVEISRALAAGPVTFSHTAK